MHDVLTKLGDWLVPALVGASIYYLRAISSAIQDLSRNLAVAVERVDSHERRIEKLEDRADERSRGD